MTAAPDGPAALEHDPPLARAAARRFEAINHPLVKEDRMRAGHHLRSDRHVPRPARRPIGMSFETGSVAQA